MSNADQIRQFCINTYINPAKARDDDKIEIRAGDVHKTMGLKSRIPGVCGAIGAEIFEDLAKVKKISVKGPHQGASTTFSFQILR